MEPPPSTIPTSVPSPQTPQTPHTHNHPNLHINIPIPNPPFRPSDPIAGPSTPMVKQEIVTPAVTPSLPGGSATAGGGGANGTTPQSSDAPAHRPMMIRFDPSRATRGPLPPTSSPNRAIGSNRGVGRGRGRGRGARGGPGAGIRGRGRGSSLSNRQSTRISQRAEDLDGAPAPRLKIRFNAASNEISGGRRTSFLGEYDRELDENADEPLVFEEQFILRAPKEVADGAGGLREMVKGKGKGLEGVEFKFLDPRRAVFKFGGSNYAAKLVDLPNILESQKTFDHRHLFKVADISQMLVVEGKAASEHAITSSPLRIDDYIWPHGITPPLRHVRRRRFRKRLSRRTIEVVEENVEELLKKDVDADEPPEFELIDAHPDPDIPDSYYIDYDPNAVWGQEGASEYGGEGYEEGATPDGWAGEYSESRDGEDGEGGYDEEGEEGEDDDGLDEELAAALMEQMEGGSDESDGSDEGLSGSEDDEDEENEKSEDDDETVEKKAKIRQFTSEIKALEAAIEKKRAGFTGGNPIMIKRFEETIAGLEADVSTKIDVRQTLIDEVDEKSRPEQTLPSTQAATPASRADDHVMSSPAAPTPMDDDVDMGEGDGEDAQEGTTPAPTPTPVVIPARKRSPQSEGDDDLFGDADAEEDDVEGEEGGTGDDGEEEGDENDDEEDEDDEGDEEEAPGQAGDNADQGQMDVDLGDDEMSAMLQAELDGLAAQDQGHEHDQNQDQVQLDLTDSQSQILLIPTQTSFLDDPQLDLVGETPSAGAADAAAALNDFTAQGGYDFSSPSGGQAVLPGLGSGVGMVEGGVGMRRLASGLVGGGGEDSSSDDDSDD